MKKFLSLSLIICSTLIFAQKKKNVDPGYKYIYKETSFETDDYKIYIEDATAIDAWSKLKVRVFNKTNDYLILKPTDVTFKIDGKEIQGTDKQLIIVPNDEASKVIDVKGPGCQVDNYSITIKTLYKVAANSPAIKAEDFVIPVAKNDFKAGNFKCTLKKHELKTDKSAFKFVCTYEGDGIGILAPTQIAAVTPKGQDNANYNRNKGTLLERGKSDDFIVDIREIPNSGDMQKEPWKLKWNETFKESKIEMIAGGTINLELDPAKTAEKNK